MTKKIDSSLQMFFLLLLFHQGEFYEMGATQMFQMLCFMKQLILQYYSMLIEP